MNANVRISNTASNEVSATPSHTNASANARGSQTDQENVATTASGKSNSSKASSGNASKALGMHGKASGPKSIAGKQKSSRNAFKSGFYSKALLPWEDCQEQDRQWDGLVKQWRAYDPSRVGLLHSYAFALLQQQRLMVIERDKIIGAMQSVDFASQFCNRAGLPITSALSIPAWFFMPDDGGEKKRAMQLGRIYDQASTLRESYSDRIAPQIQTDYPDLYRYVMSGQPVTHSFLIALGQRYRQQTTTLNLGALMQSLEERYRFHLVWSSAPERYQLVIDGLRAELVERTIDFDASFARATSLQNRLLKSLSGLAAIDRHELQVQIEDQCVNANPVIGLDEDSAEPSEESE